jgi:hypothetical protein
MNLEEIGSRALRAAIQENRVSFPAQAPVFRKHSRSDVQWRISVLYFVRGWSIRALSDRYSICNARVQQILSSWRKYAVSASYIQEIPPEGAPEVPPPAAKANTKIEVAPESKPVPAALKAIEPPVRRMPDPVPEESRHAAIQRVSVHVPKMIASYFEHPQLFGQDVNRHFPSAKFDIREAGSCLALGRNTACVYHLARAAQFALRCLCRHLGCAPYLDSLPAMIDQAESFLLDKIGSGPIGEPSADYHAATLTTLKAFQAALDDTYPGPLGAYDAPRAQFALEKTKALMQHLALRLCEQGVVLGFTQPNLVTLELAYSHKQ